MASTIFNLTAPNTQVALDDNTVALGRNGPTWGGTNPNAATGGTGNPAAGTGLSNISDNYVFSGEGTEKILKITVGTLTAGQINYIRVPKSKISSHPNKTMMGIQYLGVFNAAASEVNNTPDCSLISTVFPGLNVCKDNITIVIAAANINLFQNKTIILKVYLES